MENKFYKMSFSTVYPLYIKKAERKGRTKKEVDEIVCWLTGYSKSDLNNQIKKKVDFKTFFEESPELNKYRFLIKGSICGVKIEEIKDPLMKEIRYLDKLIDELAKGKSMDKILRSEVID